MNRVLVVDDEESLRELLSIALKGEGYEVAAAEDGVEALELMEKRPASVVLTDLSMPRMGGMDLLEKIKRRWPETIVMVITAYGTEENKLKARELGAYGFVHKPVSILDTLLKIQHGLEELRLKREVSRLRSTLGDRFELAGIVGQSEAMQRIFALVDRISDTDSTVLLTGESGTGKELIARAIHTQSRRSSGPFLTINCAAMPEPLLESELFGHVKGAFTGAVSAKKGLFEAATGGTLMMDEIADTPPAMQVKLLRVLQDGKVRPVGGNQEIPTDVRIIATTNRDLEEMVERGPFREDLFYRINVIPIHLPPLRGRSADIPILVEHFLGKYVEKIGRGPQRVSLEAMEFLEGHDWPGNIRELENVIERAVTLEAGEELTAASLPDHLKATVRGDALSEVARAFFQQKEAGGGTMDDYLAGIHKRLIEEALERAGGNKTRAAELLGTTFRSLRYYAEKFGLKIQ